jgi:hypothetical protein
MIARLAETGEGGDQMKPVAIAALAFAAAFAGVFGFQYLPPLPEAVVAPAYVPPPIAQPVTTICDDRATVETVKQLALKRFKGDTSDYLFKGAADYHDQQMAWINSSSGSVDLSLGAFRERGKLGRGATCAAILSVKSSGQVRTVELATEYSVEPTTDGKVMVSARFMPN